MSHSCARSTSSSWNSSMITIIFTDVPLPLTQSRIIWAFSGLSQMTVEMVAGTEGTVLNDPACLMQGGVTALQSASLRYLCRWCRWWPPCPECHTAEPPPESTYNRPVLKCSTEREDGWYSLLYIILSWFVRNSCWCSTHLSLYDGCVCWTSGLFMEKMPINLSPVWEWPLCRSAEPMCLALSTTCGKKMKEI